MAWGRRKKERQQEMWVETAALPRSDGHVFYCKLNRLLAAAGFDEFVESLCEEHGHNTMGRPGIPPGRFFGCCWSAILKASAASGASRGVVPTAFRCVSFSTCRCAKRRLTLRA